MSTFFDETYTCAVCGKEAQYEALGSTNTFGGTADLDGRPPEMARSTMSFWVQECPHCGYVSDSVADPTTVTQQWLQGEAYTGCDGIAFASSLAKRFYKQYLINQQDKNHVACMYAALHAAWACDDYGEEENAILCRKLALQEMAQIPEAADNEDCLLQKADLLRRTGQFDRLATEFADFTFEDPFFQKLLEFQLEKAREGDTLCYRIGDVTGNPF